MSQLFWLRGTSNTQDVQFATSKYLWSAYHVHQSFSHIMSAYEEQMQCISIQQAYSREFSTIHDSHAVFGRRNAAGVNALEHCADAANTVKRAKYLRL